MLNTDYCVTYLADIREFADRTNQREQLEEKLRYLERYAIHEGDAWDKTRCTLFKDFAPYSFKFLMEQKQDDGSYRRWFNGGLIYHGYHDGGGWSIHT